MWFSTSMELPCFEGKPEVTGIYANWQNFHPSIHPSTFSIVFKYLTDKNSEVWCLPLSTCIIPAVLINALKHVLK